MDAKPHSIEQFGPQRDFWWNPDFLELMAHRWRLRDADSLADIGCGVGHWSRLLYPHLRAPARLTGVDREPRWVAEAARRFRESFPQVPAERVSFVEGDAARIPLPDNQFNVVTCQTVLMHLPRPAAAIGEMVRILRPGGLLVCVEPNNLWNYISVTSLTPNESVEALVRQFEFWLRYHRGKIAHAEGDHTFGDLLPGALVRAGLREVTVYQSDRAAALFPPYATPAQKAMLDQEAEWKNSATGPWNREDVRRNVLAGGGTEVFFEQVFLELIQKFKAEQAAVAAGEFHAAGGAINYLVSGRKSMDSG
jgi:SAM-dependent methyltransferase